METHVMHRKRQGNRVTPTKRRGNRKPNASLIGVVISATGVLMKMIMDGHLVITVTLQ